jgi:hypothetical protein
MTIEYLGLQTWYAVLIAKFTGVLKVWSVLYFSGWSKIPNGLHLLNPSLKTSNLAL